MNGLIKFLRKLGGLYFVLVAVFYLSIYQLRTFETALSVEVLAFLGGLILSGAFVWQKYESRWPHLQTALEDFLSFFLAYIFCFYALGKVFDLQFVVPPEMLEQKAGELEGFWKAWLFFGHSYRYNLLLAIVELAAAAFILPRRTRTAGALLYAGVMTNIVAIDFAYDVVYLQTTASLFLLTAIYLMLGDLKRIRQFVFSLPAKSENLTTSEPPKLSVFRTLLFFFLTAAVVCDVIFFFDVSQSLK